MLTRTRITTVPSTIAPPTRARNTCTAASACRCPPGAARLAGIRGYRTGMEGSAAGPPAAGIQGFPVALTSFVGRAGVLHEIDDLLAEYRLVTVTGPGGVGKTRLAGEVARQVADRFADGARLVELAAVPDPAQVPAAVVAALGVRPPPGVPATEALTRVLARRQLLVVLDNCEHVIGAAAALCGELLRACDDLRILATSREALRIAGESAYRLAPLPVPDSACRGRGRRGGGGAVCRPGPGGRRRVRADRGEPR